MSLLLGRGAYEFEYVQGSFAPKGTTDLYAMRKMQPAPPNYKTMRIHWWNHLRIDPEPAVEGLTQFTKMYLCDEDILRRSVAYQIKNNIYCPWLLPDELVSSVYRHGTTLAVNIFGRRHMFNAYAIWASYVVWLHFNNLELPEFQDLDSILHMAKEVYNDREGYGNIVHMYHTFRYCNLSFSMPTNWVDIILKRDDMAVFNPRVEVPLVEDQRSEDFADLVIQTINLGEEQVSVMKDPATLNIQECYDQVSQGIPVNYYGPYIPGLRGVVLGIPWSMTKCVVIIDKSQRNIDKFTFESSILVANSNKVILNGTDGCCCKRCTIECSYIACSRYGLEWQKSHSQVLNHDYGVGLSAPPWPAVYNLRKEIYFRMAVEYVTSSWTKLSFLANHSMSDTFFFDFVHEYDTHPKIINSGPDYLVGFSSDQIMDKVCLAYSQDNVHNRGFYFQSLSFKNFGLPNKYFLQSYQITRSFLQAALRTSYNLHTNGDTCFVGPSLRAVNSSLVLKISRRIISSGRKYFTIGQLSKITFGSKGRDVVQRSIQNLVRRKIVVRAELGFSFAESIPPDKIS